MKGVEGTRLIEWIRNTERKTMELADVMQAGYTGALSATPGGDAPWTRVERITPSRAAEILRSLHGKQRRLRPWRVKLWADRMRDGKWMLTNDAICFSPSGDLMNGQHRLHAVVESGASITAIVAYNVPEDAYEGMDQNEVRVPRDYLDQYMSDRRNTTNLTAAIRQVIHYKTVGTYRKPYRGEAVEFSDYLDFAMAHPEIYSIVSRTGKQGFYPLAATGTTLAALYFLFREKDEDYAELFFDQLETGAGLSEGDPILTLRNQLTRLKMRATGTADQVYCAALIVRAWNIWIKGDSARALRVTDEFPGILDPADVSRRRRRKG